MKNKLYKLSLIIAALMFASAAAFADVKVKSRQTMSGQTYENTTYIKGKRQRTEAMNGMSVSLTQCDLRRTVQLNPNAKTYMINSFNTVTDASAAKKPEARSTAVTDKDGVVQAGGLVTVTYTIKDTGERKQMFGYTARHLIITMESKSSPDACNKANTKMQTDGWYIDTEFALDCDWGQNLGAGGGGKADGGCKDRYEMKTVGTAKRGYPVYEKMTMFDASGKESFTMTNEVLELSKATLEASLFDIPDDYRQVTDPMEMYAGMASAGAARSTPSKMKLPNTDADGPGKSGNVEQNGSNIAQKAPALGPKKPGTIRIGIVGVKTGAVGDSISPDDLSAAVENTLAQYLKAPNLETVEIDAKVSSAIAAEAREKDCDYVIVATASHKKGGGGFGMFSKVIAPAVGAVGIGHTGSRAGNIAGNVATRAVVNAGHVAGNVKAKDEITLDIKLDQPGRSTALAKVYKAKAKADRDDLVTQVIEQAAEAIVAAVGK